MEQMLATQVPTVRPAEQVVWALPMQLLATLQSTLLEDKAGIGPRQVQTMAGELMVPIQGMAVVAVLTMAPPVEVVQTGW
jgi:hypothetical protein